MNKRIYTVDTQKKKKKSTNHTFVYSLKNLSLFLLQNTDWILTTKVTLSKPFNPNLKCTANIAIVNIHIFTRNSTIKGTYY